MADKQKTTKDEPDFYAIENRLKVAQEIANATGMGAKYIADQLEAADAWTVATDLLLIGAIDEIRELLKPQNKAV